jgi:Zn-dependent M28 family amino/carboxypeptidase
LDQRLRSVLFLVPTVEEFGLLGSDYYVKTPVINLARCLACFNFDLINIFGKTKDISFYGSGQNNLEQLAHHWATSRQHREVKVSVLILAVPIVCAQSMIFQAGSDS